MHATINVSVFKVSENSVAFVVGAFLHYYNTVYTIKQYNSFCNSFISANYSNSIYHFPLKHFYFPIHNSYYCNVTKVLLAQSNSEEQLLPQLFQ